jgi:hypothetical protein
VPLILDVARYRHDFPARGTDPSRRLFGVGLLLSGMTDPSKVIGFLDIAGRWDPSLAFVMAGAILVGFFAFAAARRRARTFFGDALRLPERREA